MMVQTKKNAKKEFVKILEKDSKEHQNSKEGCMDLFKESNSTSKEYFQELSY